MTERVMPGPLFSIVIPTYNRCDLLQGTLQSVLAQSIADFEVVVSDNCSDDDTRQVTEGFVDSRVRYIRTPRHTSIADSWEFARSHARGALVMMLSDDDALVRDALARFAEEHHEGRADFLFCNVAEYRDQSFVGPEQNTLRCGAFSGAARVVEKDEFLRPLFAMRPKFDMHPSAFMFSASLADQVIRRCGRFFDSNGVEYFAWPLAAVFSTRMVHIDAPLVILGRTFKSWGSTIVLANPGKEQIAKMIADVNHDRRWIPLTNFTLTNLMAEGLLLGKKMFPDELQPYPFDEERYLRRTMKELRSRQRMGVDVARETSELTEYAIRYPSLHAKWLVQPPDELKESHSLARRLATGLGAYVRRRLDARRQIRDIRAGRVHAGFTVSGGDFGFNDALGCSEFLSAVMSVGQGRKMPANLRSASARELGR
jgi:glycosyltransferase involved in cell wall biosynthesis